VRVGSKRVLWCCVCCGASPEDCLSSAEPPYSLASSSSSGTHTQPPRPLRAICFFPHHQHPSAASTPPPTPPQHHQQRSTATVSSLWLLPRFSRSCHTRKHRRWTTLRYSRHRHLLLPLRTLSKLHQRSVGLLVYDSLWLSLSLSLASPRAILAIVPLTLARSVSCRNPSQRRWWSTC